MKRNTLSLAASLAVSLLLPALGAHAQSAATDADLAQKVDKLSAELAALKAQVQASPAAAPAEPATVLTSYGEINYNRPTKKPENAQADVRRFVLGFQHRFDDKTKVVTELEVEHGVSSADDAGEVEVEQAFIEHQLMPGTALRAGLFLMPVGLLNENHEPPAFLGVERNVVETAIIPSTWREGGLQYVGSFDNGLTVQAGLSTTFDLSKWDATSTEGAESPLAAVHQEMSLAKARDVAVFGAANWRGIPGLLLGGSLFTSNATQGQAGFPSARITLWDLHARWTPQRWDLSALYTQGHISNTAELNAPLVGSATLIPERFEGWYVQTAYTAWTSGDQALSPFARYERYNTASRYADLGAGLTPDALPTERVFTVGANYKLNANVVVKLDLQRFKENKDNNRFDLGLGWSF